MMSLKAGGVGLNVTCANYVYLMDSWWNGAVEDQAISRVHRLGQKYPVEVVRFVVRDSIEERVLELQRRKQDMIAATIGGGVRNSAENRLEELKLLMRRFTQPEKFGIVS
jgi:SNF2 family DNA or RNA helicase